MDPRSAAVLASCGYAVQAVGVLGMPDLPSIWLRMPISLRLMRLASAVRLSAVGLHKGLPIKRFNSASRAARLNRVP